jgi:glycerol-3-phosphate dehydrogenase
MGADERRGRRLRALQEPFDVIVVGGGVNGTGTAWDAALRGLRVLLVERDDLGSGTSAWSSRLIHGGLKYLEKLDVALVRESLREREWLLGAAPHLVRPLRMIMPAYRGGTHSPAALWAGMLAYDALSYGKSVPTHQVWTRTKTLRRVPGLRADGLVGAAAYYDGQSELAERLCVEVGIAAEDQGAVLLTHAEVDAVDVHGGVVQGVTLTDRLTGARHAPRAPLVLNMAGPWLDEVVPSVARSRRLVGGTKGSHFVLDRFDGAPAEGEGALYYESDDGRPMLLLPWRGQLLIGSTDLRYEGDLDMLGPSREEVDYVVGQTNRVFPQARLTPDDLLWGYTGVRPLPSGDGDGDVADITRRHAWHDHGPGAQGLVSLVGGKLTTFRQVAEEAADLALARLGRPKRRSATRRLRLPGAGAADLGAFTEAFVAASGLPEPVARRVAGLYGTRASGIAELARADDDLREVVDAATHLTAAEIAYCLEEENAVTLTDVLARRTMVGIGPTLPAESVDRAAAVCGRLSGWDEARTRSELDAFRRRLARFAIPGRSVATRGAAS